MIINHGDIERFTHQGAMLRLSVGTGDTHTVPHHNLSDLVRKRVRDIEDEVQHADFEYSSELR